MVVELALRVRDPAGTVERDVAVEAGERGTAADLVETLVDLLGWPRETLDGRPIAYAARRLGSDGPLDPRALVEHAGLLHGDALVVGPSVIGGDAG